MKILLTGGAGFIGSAVVRHLIGSTQDVVVNVDKLTYAGNTESLAPVLPSPRHVFEQADICDAAALERIFREQQPDAVMHLAAESHVDRSIDAPAAFMQANIIGTYTLLEATRRYLATLDAARQQAFRFHHVSTDEVYGDLAGSSALASEGTAYAPGSPYAASKAGADHLVRAWGRTYGLPVVLSNCSNNYGPCQFPEKLVPLMILNALEGRPLPVYGAGEQIRDWLYVDDHVRALHAVVRRGRVGETYNIGAHDQRRNIEVVRAICALLEELAPQKPAGVRRYEDLIRHVPDRPGHDRRYALDAGKISRELGWAPLENFASGLRKTVVWYLQNSEWCRHVQDGSYRRQRLGMGA